MLLQPPGRRGTTALQITKIKRDEVGEALIISLCQSTIEITLTADTMPAPPKKPPPPHPGIAAIHSAEAAHVEWSQHARTPYGHLPYGSKARTASRPLSTYPPATATRRR